MAPHGNYGKQKGPTRARCLAQILESLPYPDVRTSDVKTLVLDYIERLRDSDEAPTAKELEALKLLGTLCMNDDGLDVDKAVLEMLGGGADDAQEAPRLEPQDREDDARVH